MIPDTYPPSSLEEGFDGEGPISPFEDLASDFDEMAGYNEEYEEYEEYEDDHGGDHTEANDFESTAFEGDEFVDDWAEADYQIEDERWPSDGEYEEAPYPPAGRTLAEAGLLDDEAEAFLGNLWDSTKAVWEKALVGMAIARGQRDANELTNLVFFRRHPERQGRPLARSEPRFRELAGEWTMIRNTIVVPALSGGGPGSVRPTGGPGRSPAGPTPASPMGGDWARIRADLVTVANRELAYWSNGSLKEGNERGWKRVEQYWAGSIGKWRPKGRHGHVLATKHAWSAVFICWAVRQAGVDASTFRARANHSNYMVDLIRAESRSSGRPVAVVSPYSTTLRPGDLINNWRKSRFDFDRLRRAAAGRKFPNWPSHTDIVVEVVPGSHAFVIGGNKGHSVKRVKVKVDANGVLMPGRWTAVIRMGP